MSTPSTIDSTLQLHSIPAPAQRTLPIEPYNSLDCTPAPFFPFDGLDTPNYASPDTPVFGQHPSSLTLDVDMDRISQLEAENSKLRCQVADLQGFQRGVKQAYMELAKACPQALALTNNPYSLPVSTATDSSAKTDNQSTTTTETIQLAELVGRKLDIPYSAGERDKCDSVVQYWLEDEWTKARKDDADLLTSADGEKQKGKRGEMNTTARYITDHAGEPVDGPRLGAIRRTLRGLWGHMPAPAASWAEGTSQHVHLQIYIGLATLCPEVGFCADNWKARVLCTASYPNWIRTRLPKTKTEVKEEAGTSDSNSGKRKRLSEGENMAVEGQDGHHDLPIKRPHLAEQTSVDLMDVDDSTPPMLTPSLDEAEKSAPNEKLPTPKNPLFSGGRRKIVPQQIFSAPEPTSPLPSLQHGSEAPSASVQTPPIGETPPTAGTTDTLANSVPAKNQAVYKPSKTSKSARGLCAVDWMSKTENKAKTAEEFDEFWKGTIMSSAALKKRWDKRSAAAHGSMQEAVASTGVSGQRRSSRKAPAAQEDA